MKKQLSTFILLLFPMMMVGQTMSTDDVLYEKDFTGITEFTDFYMFADEQTDGKVEVDPDGLAIIVGVQTGSLWQPQVMAIPDESFNLEEGGNYKVVITAKFPTDGTLQITMGTWSANDQNQFPVTATGDFQEVVCNFDSWPVNADGAHLLFQCGDFKGTTILKKIQVVGSSPNSVSIDNIFYSINLQNKTARVIKNPQKYQGIVNIPTTIMHEGTEYTVKIISNEAFEGCNGLTSITIPNSVTSIEGHAFSVCTGLISITIPNSVTSIGESAFSGCTGLTSITIPNSVTSIGDYAFLWCSGLTSITIPNSVTSIGGAVFSGCTGLTSITIPNKLTSIGNFVFEGCSGLTSITIPNSVTSIRDWAFAYCTGLTSITIPNSVRSIGFAAFEGCSGLTSITIPNKLTSIGDYAFSGCSGLTSIISLNNTPPTCEQNDYDGSYNHFKSVDKTNCVLWVPKGSVIAYKEADGWKDFQNFKELTFGDVNLDGEVNQNDLDALVGFIMGENPESFYEGLADLNDDNEVNAADVVKLVAILNVQDGLSTNWQPNFDSNQVITSLACTLNNNGDKPIQVTKCELYHDQSLVSYATSNVTLDSGESKKCSFDDLASLYDNKGFYVVWYYTYNGESYTCRFNLPE